MSADEIDTAAEILQREIAETIAEIREAKGAAACRAHDSLTRATVVLLRCQSVLIGRQGVIMSCERRDSVTVASVSAGVAGALLALAEAAKYLLQ
jgi:hypothetical protein